MTDITNSELLRMVTNLRMDLSSLRIDVQENEADIWREEPNTGGSGDGGDEVLPMPFDIIEWVSPTQVTIRGGNVEVLRVADIDIPNTTLTLTGSSCYALLSVLHDISYGEIAIDASLLRTDSLWIRVPLIQFKLNDAGGYAPTLVYHRGDVQYGSPN